MNEVGRPLVYIPEDAKINISNHPMEDIKVKYEKSKAILDREKVNDVVKGIYGSSSESSAKL